MKEPPSSKFYTYLSRVIIEIISLETWERLEKPAGSFPAPTAMMCGLKCSMMETWCGMFHYDKNNKICIPAKVKCGCYSSYLNKFKFPTMFFSFLVWKNGSSFAKKRHQQYQFLVLRLVMPTVWRWSKSTLIHGRRSPVPKVTVKNLFLNQFVKTGTVDLGSVCPLDFNQSFYRKFYFCLYEGGGI